METHTTSHHPFAVSLLPGNLLALHPSQLFDGARGTAIGTASEQSAQHHDDVWKRRSVLIRNPPRCHDIARGPCPLTSGSRPSEGASRRWPHCSQLASVDRYSRTGSYPPPCWTLAPLPCLDPGPPSPPPPCLANTPRQASMMIGTPPQGAAAVMISMQLPHRVHLPQGCTPLKGSVRHSPSVKEDWLLNEGGPRPLTGNPSISPSSRCAALTARMQVIPSSPASPTGPLARPGCSL